jgi:hypothetical protein
MENGTKSLSSQLRILIAFFLYLAQCYICCIYSLYLHIMTFANVTGGSQDPAIFSREEAEDGDSFTVTIECGLGNEYDGRMGVRISAIFVIFFGSMLGCVIPLLLGRFYRHSGLAGAFFAARFFGSGVIVSTAFIHLLAPAIAALYSPCLEQDSPITTYAWPEAICLMSVFAMFVANLVGDHFVGKGNGLINTTGNPPGSLIYDNRIEQGISSTTKGAHRPTLMWTS